MQVKVINKSNNILPKYETPQSAGMDLRADFSRINMVDGKPEFFFNTDSVAIHPENGKQVIKTIEIKPFGRCLIPTGLFIALPQGYEAQIRPRSGLALKKGLTVLNTPGTIDAEFIF